MKDLDTYSGAQQAGYAADVKQTALGSLLMAVKLLSEAAMSSRTVADKLCGGSPENAATKISALPNGTFDEIEHAAETIEGFSRQIIGDMHRIENRL